VKKDAAKVERDFIKVANLDNFGFNGVPIVQLYECPPIPHHASCKHTLNDKAAIILYV
jgi:hypothetical protein